MKLIIATHPITNEFLMETLLVISSEKNDKWNLLVVEDSNKNKCSIRSFIGDSFYAAKVGDKLNGQIVIISA